RGLPAPEFAGGFWRGLAIFSAASVAVLAAASVFALASASLVGYLLARRLVARLERLGRAAEALAAGDLSQRVEEGPPDEVGQLARRFNRMADRLAATVSELEAERRQAQVALQAKRELVANVSHELRTPVASIRAHTESLLMLGQEAAPERRAEALDVVHRETEHLSRLIEDLFVLATTEAGALPLALGTVDVGAVVAEVGRSFDPLARRGKVSLLTAVEPSLPAVRADRARLVQLLGNLVRNALRFTPEGGLVSLRAERAGEAIRVAVEDTGIGVPPEDIPRLFERFYRGDESRDRASGGAGLGLAIVRELVEAMGGEVGVDSEPGQGSRFWFTLPCADSAKECAQPPVAVVSVDTFER
ncbi:MAG: HAMP domain-containing histidine kinase, partial [Chloroflexota bacterium]|nr:HAMP domain-containing histidine kinase [Chloroflexota bacterium]